MPTDANSLCPNYHAQFDEGLHLTSSPMSWNTTNSDVEVELTGDDDVPVVEAVSLPVDLLQRPNAA